MNKNQKLVQQQFLNNEEKIISRLIWTYDQSLKDVNKQIKNLQFKIDDLQETYDWMDDDDPEKAIIKSKIQSKIYQKQYQEQLKSQLDGIMNQLHTKSYLTVSDYLDDCYTDGFIGTVFDAHGQGVPIITPINQEAMVRAVQLESKISVGLYTKMGENIEKLKKRIASQVSRGISSGMTYSQVAGQLEKFSKFGYNRAITIARTEGHRIQNTAAKDAMDAAKEKGADVLKQWDSTLDDVTRESHRQVDGEIRELDKSFSNGLDFPGDPDGGAAEVINCRCALLQRARWALDESFTKFNGFTRQIESFESPKDYGEFKKAFFSKENESYVKYVKRMESKYGTKNFEKLLDVMTDEEYDKFSLFTVKNPIFNKKGLENYDKNGIIRLGVVRDAINSNSVSLTINADKQNRHIVGSKGYVEGKSLLLINLDEAQKIVNKYGGTGNPIFDGNGDWARKERVTCPGYVGIHIDKLTGKQAKTKNLTIVYSNTGTHIIPRGDG